MLSRRRRLPSIAAVPVLAVAAWAILAGAPGTEGGGSDATIAIGSAAVAPGGEVTVDLIVTPAQGIFFGGADLEVNYDSAVVTVLSCAVATGGVCNPFFDQNTVRYSLASTSGFQGVVGAITFEAIGSSGASSLLDLVILQCFDTQGTLLTCGEVDGQISIAVPTPSPTPSPPPPTPTPAPPRLWGDVDCSGAINSVDSLKILRWKAGLTVSQTQPCPVIGAHYP